MKPSQQIEVNLPPKVTASEAQLLIDRHTVAQLEETTAMIDGAYLIQQLEDLGLEPRCYSGRGMYGKECVAIFITSYREAMRLVVDISFEDDQLGNQLISGAYFDNMGRDIVLYWPRAEVPAQLVIPRANP